MSSSMLIHPEEMIKDDIIARGLTQEGLLEQTGISCNVFNGILNGKHSFTTE